MSYIEFKNVKKIYHVGEVDIEALAGVDFTINKGEVVIVAGASGAGKSTILNILGGMDTCSSGEIVVDGSRIDEMGEKAAHLTKLRDKLIQGIQTRISNVKLNGHPTRRLPNNINFSFEFVEGESLLIKLDMEGICASSGSACTSGSLDPSHVLLAIGLPHEIAHGSLRLTLSEETTKEELDFTVDKLKEIVQYLRSMSPLYEDFMKNQK